MSFPNSVPPDEARQRWHTEARERDEAYLALGPIDQTEWVDDYEQALQVATEGGTVDWGREGDPNERA